jgi:hypothetical protein
MRSGDDGGDIVACSPREAAARAGESNAASLATVRGDIVERSRSRGPAGDPALGDFEDAVILTVGEVNTGLLSV